MGDVLTSASGNRQIDPGSLGAGFYLVTAIVPPFLVSHVLVFRFLISKS
jgi:hypothetical protein